MLETKLRSRSTWRTSHPVTAI